MLDSTTAAAEIRDEQFLAEAMPQRPGRHVETVQLLVGRIVLIAAILALWQAVSGRLVQEFWISSPVHIFERLVDWVRTGYLFFHLVVTLEEMILGFLLGAITGIASGFILGGNRFLARLLDPIIIAIYSLPKIALAPLFILWFGIGLNMKVVLGATIVYFLVFWNTYAGVTDVDHELVDVIRVMGAKRRHIVQKIVLPGAIPWIYVGLKLSVPYALVAAVFGELLASNRGLGYILGSAANQFDTAGLFAALVVLMIISMILNEVLNRTEGALLRWKVAGQDRP